MLSWLDLSVIVLYVLACTALGAWLGRGMKGLSGYFLGERDTPFWAVLISIVATETSTVSFLSVPGKAYGPDGNMLFLQLAIGYIVGRIVVAFVLLPMYFEGRIYSAYQILGERYGPAVKGMASLLFLAMRTAGDGIRLFLTAALLEHMLGLDSATSIMAMALFTIAYTYIGGMKAVIWTDVIQFVVYIVGAAAALALIVSASGGWGAVASQSDHFRIFDFSFDWTNPYNFPAGLIGGAVLAMATHGADQLMVQRYLAARSRRQAAGALIASGFVVFLQFALFLTIGAALSYLYYVKTTYGQGAGGPPQPDSAFLTFLSSAHMADGLRGLIVASLLAAAMSTLSSSLNSSAAAAVSDLVLPIWKERDEGKLLVVSRMLTAFWGLAQMGVALTLAALNTKRSAIDMVLEIASLSAGILLGLFLAGLALRRVSQIAGLIGLCGGAALVIWVRFNTKIAFPWFALIGSSSVFALTLAASLAFRPAAAPVPVPDNQPDPASSTE